MKIIAIETFNGNKLRLQLVEEQVEEFNKLKDSEKLN